MHSQFLASTGPNLRRGHEDCIFIGNIQKHGPESCEAITRLASFTDAHKLTDRQLKLSDPGTHSMHASSSSQSSVRVKEAPGPIKLAIELMKLFNSRTGSETGLWSIAGAISINTFVRIRLEVTLLSILHSE